VAQAELAATTAEVDTLRQEAAQLRDALVRERQQQAALGQRIAAVREDLREHQDILTLARLGSPQLERLRADCPVCHQKLPDTLIGEMTIPPASPEAAVDYLRRQLELFQVMQEDGAASLGAREERLRAIERAAADGRARIRHLKDALTSPNDVPSVELLARRIRLDDRISELERISERFLATYGALERIASDLRSVRAALNELPKDRFSETDEAKLAMLESLFVKQLHAYDFGSFSDERLRISRDDYLPRREDFDLQADISASDAIRVVWAYLLALFEVAAETPTNHPGFLVLDEPRQQSAKGVSFAALLQRAGHSGEQRQVIFATSEELSSLKTMLAGVSHELHSVDGYLLKPV
jgi:hypothetical protein